MAFDGKFTFDRLTDVYNSGTAHDEDQPVHLVVIDPYDLPSAMHERVRHPCENFCPAAVYEMVEGRLQINASNCVHCKTCDIMDPYQIINWIPPEGGGGPSYDLL
jgi:electron-transferring-flavoprotein dehydrogenase